MLLQQLRQRLVGNIWAECGTHVVPLCGCGGDRGALSSPQDRLLCIPQPGQPIDVWGHKNHDRALQHNFRPGHTADHGLADAATNEVLVKAHANQGQERPTEEGSRSPPVYRIRVRVPRIRKVSVHILRGLRHLMDESWRHLEP